MNCKVAVCERGIEEFLFHPDVSMIFADGEMGGPR